MCLQAPCTIVTVVVATGTETRSAGRVAGVSGRSGGVRRETVRADIIDCRDSKVTFEWTIRWVMLKVDICCLSYRSSKSADSLGIDSFSFVLVGIGMRTATWNGCYRAGSICRRLRRRGGAGTDSKSCGGLFKTMMRFSTIMTRRWDVRW